MNYTNINIRNFIDQIISFDNVKQILKSCQNVSEKGFIFERLFDICIKFGFSIFNNYEYQHLTGNSNDGILKSLNFDNYLKEKVISGKSSGCSDITLKNKETSKYIFISSKYYSNEETIDKYDIQNIISIIDHNKYIYKDYEIYLVVKNKNKLFKKINNSDKKSKYLTKYIKESNILDLNDLNCYFIKFKKDIINNLDKNFNEIYLNQKERLKLRFHQELITEQTSKLIQQNHKSFLWGCKCRSGKTFMAGGIILKLFNIRKKLNILIITPAPSETIPQFTEDLFSKFRNFDNFYVNNIKNSKYIDRLELKENNIIIISKQLLQKYIDDNVVSLIRNLKLDLIIFDENHFSGTTDLSKSILDSYTTKNTCKIYLTATYQKPLTEWNILKECQMYWDIEDEQLCKKRDIYKLKEKHNIENINIEDLRVYDNMPNLHLITNMFDQKRYQELKKNLDKDNKFGFCFDTLFALTKTKTRFLYEEQVITFLRYISSSNIEVDGKETIFFRIKRIATEQDTRLPFTQIWFLPPNNINETSLCLKALMKEDPILKRYYVMNINRKCNEIKNVKDDIEKSYIESIERGNKGLILLAGNMLNLGITIKSCDMVILLNNSLSSDKVMQQMYRCMTEDDNKKIGFVVDLNISRVLNTCINYTIYKNEHDISAKLKYMLDYNLINIDIDHFDNKKCNSDIIVKKLMDIWKDDPINGFKILLRKLDNDYEEFDNYTQKLLNKYFTKSLKDNLISASVLIKDSNDEEQILPTGKTRDKEENNTEYNLENEEDKIEEIKISFTKDVLPYIIPLTCILTVKNSNMDFVKMLNDIKENPELLEIFDEQCLIWFNNKNLIDIIKDIINKYFDKNSNTYNISIQFKMNLQNLIDKPKELLELINDCLKPKESEKKQFGEVFTPIKLVNEMLDKLPKEVWKNKDLKWLDPAVGMGNFPVIIYLRLIETLKDIIIDENERKKHIIENMLYMCEINKKNVLICKQIFNFNNEYKMNIYEGDSLILNYKDYFGIDKFDIIVGNPPYQDNQNAKGKRGGGDLLWNKFVILSLELLDKNKYLCFIHPAGWRKPESEKSKFKNLFKIMTEENQMLYLEIHDTKDGLKIFSAGTRYDWYIIKKIKQYTSTEIKGEDNKIINLNLSEWNFLPNYNFDKIYNLLSKDQNNNCEIIYSVSSYETRKKWISSDRTNEYKYPLIHSTPKSGIRYMYSSKNDNGHFGIPKVIFGDSGIYDSIIDIDGKYGMTQHSIAIKVSNIDEANYIKNYIDSDDFRDILDACSWSNFQIDWRLFTYLKKDFYNEFLNNLKTDNETIENNETVKKKVSKSKKLTK